MAGFCQVSSVAVLLKLLRLLYRCLIVDIIGLKFLRSFLFPFLKIITILAFFHAVGIRLFDKHLVYSLASVFEMVSSPAFNVSMFIWSLLVAAPFVVLLPSPMILLLVHLLGQCRLWYSVHCRIARCRIPLFFL